MANEVELAREYCEGVTRKYAKSFYFAAKFLPKHKQLAVYPIYAFCRHVDDAVDETEFSSDQNAIETVESWKATLDKVYGSGEIENQILKTESQNLIFTAWKDLLAKYKIPQNLPFELIEGVLMDTTVKRYETFENLYVYCYRVASTVGLMSSEILGYKDKIALEYAEALGIAMQLTNILRDIKEDAGIGRIYLPQEDLRKFEITEQEIIAGEMSENFVEMMKFQIERARNYYAKGDRAAEGRRERHRHHEGADDPRPLPRGKPVAAGRFTKI
jgi:phytoene synthase